MENEYQTKEMKPAMTTLDVAPVVKVPKDGKLYEEGGRWKFKIAGEVYQYKTKELAKAGLELVANG
jgi:hypothetical protein